MTNKDQNTPSFSGEENKEIEKENSKNVPKRQIIFIDIDEEITGIFDRIEKSKIKDVFLVVPNRAVILQTAVNFKILKNKADELGKTVAIVSDDPNTTKLAALAGLAVYKNIENEKSQQVEFEEEEDMIMSISPIAASSNEVHDNEPRRIARKKLSIADILNMKREIQERNLPEKQKPAESHIKKIKIEPEEERQPLSELRPSRRTIFTLIGASLVLFLVIGYIALPGATISITPKSEVLSTSINIIFADAQKNSSLVKSKEKNAVATYPLAKTIGFEGRYAATGKNFKGSNSRGILTIINTEARVWNLVERTRFQTEDGIVFRLLNAVDVPAANGDIFGQIEAEVEADPLDIYEKVVGERGNIGPTKFFLPGLRESSRDKLYAESKTNFSGGSSASTPLVLEEDINAARQFVIDELNKKVLEEMQREVEAYNQVNGTKLSLLTGDGALSFGDARINIPQGIVGTEVEDFEVSGEMPVKALMYDYESFLEILSENIKEIQSPDKKLVKIEENSLEYKIFENDPIAAQLKATASIKAIEEYSIDENSEEGLRLIKKIKERVVDLPIEEARDRIQNLPEVHTVEINSWPMWSPRMPTVIENIDINIVSN